jgi:hypothetical protein
MPKSETVMLTGLRRHLIKWREKNRADVFLLFAVILAGAELVGFVRRLRASCDEEG